MGGTDLPWLERMMRSLYDTGWDEWMSLISFISQVWNEAA